MLKPTKQYYLRSKIIACFNSKKLLIRQFGNFSVTQTIKYSIFDMSLFRLSKAHVQLYGMQRINGGKRCQRVIQSICRFGLAVGARKMIDSEYQHAVDSINSGVYITYWNGSKKSECSRLGKHSKCFCGHQFPNHNGSLFGKKFNTACKNCPCKRFMFVPSRPEECGMYWLVRRKDFDVASWRPPCKCKHTCEEHASSYPLRCKKCSCSDFTSNFACLTCDGSWQDHQVLYEMGEDRQMQGKPIGQKYLPLATHQHIQKEVFNKQKYSMIKGKSLPPSKIQEKKKEQVHSQLNPVRPSKAQQQKIKSPFGFVFQPKYPDFMKK